MRRLLLGLLVVLLVAGGAAALLAGDTQRHRAEGEREHEVPGVPESYEELAKANAQYAARSLAPMTALKPGVRRSALRERAALPTAGAAWKPYGTPPLRGDNTD